MVDFQLYAPLYFDSLNYQLDEDQQKFTSGIKECTQRERCLEDPCKRIAVIFTEEKPVGFLVLDQGKDKFKLTDNVHAVLIRSFSINPLYQGKGIARQAMVELSGFVKRIFPDSNELVLSVNVKNHGAYRVYLKAGFVDEGKTIEGQLGPQHVLSKWISV